MRQRRTRAQLHNAGETPDSIRVALYANQERAMRFIQTEEGAREFSEMQRVLIDELAILEGRMFPNSIDYDHA